MGLLSAAAIFPKSVLDEEEMLTGRSRALATGEEAWPLIEKEKEEQASDEHEESRNGSMEERLPQR